jgi:hypothetical protein
MLSTGSKISKELSIERKGTLVTDYDNMWDGSVSATYWTASAGAFTESRGGISISCGRNSSFSGRTAIDLRTLMATKKMQFSFCLAGYARSSQWSNDDTCSTSGSLVLTDTVSSSTLASISCTARCDTDSISGRDYDSVATAFASGVVCLTWTATNTVNVKVHLISSNIADAHNWGGGSGNASSVSVVADNTNVDITGWSALYISTSGSSSDSNNGGEAAYCGCVISAFETVSAFLDSKGTGGTTA